jgi:hypothetical protein
VAIAAGGALNASVTGARHALPPGLAGGDHFDEVSAAWTAKK